MKKNKFIICTVGTSISAKTTSHRVFLSRKSNWSDNTDEFEKEIMNSIGWLGKEGIGKDEFRKISAETNSIDRLSISCNDRVVLLSSDTAQGKACSNCLRRIISDYYSMPLEYITIERIEGLQVYDSTMLKKNGLNNLIATTIKYLDDKSISGLFDVVINPTGGFKGVIPFLTILGMMYAAKTVYIFEFSEELIYLPPLPFTFNISIFNRARSALEYVSNEIAVTEQDYLSKIKGFVEGEREMFLAFVEPYEDKLTISSLAYCFLSVEKNSVKPIILESIVSDLKNDNSQPGLALKRLISRSSDPLWRNGHSESWRTSDLIVIKQPKTSERLAGFVKDNTFHVTHAFRTHNEYENKLGGCSVKDYADSKFINWLPSEDFGVAEVDDECGLIRERDQLILDNKKISEDNKSLEEQLGVVCRKKDEILTELKKVLTKQGCDFSGLADYDDLIIELWDCFNRLDFKNLDVTNKLKFLEGVNSKLVKENHDLKEELNKLSNNSNISFFVWMRRVFGIKM